MDSQRWKRIEELFEQAMEVGPDRRSTFLEDACAGDSDLLSELQALLEAEGSAGAFLEEAVDAAASDWSGAREDSETAAERPGGDNGWRIGPYELVRELGSGGMGSVQLAVRADDQYHRKVAIKLMHGHVRTPDALRRFRAERQILANLDHPNIGRMIDGGTTEDGTPYVVMEYVDGEPIDRYCDRRRLTTRQRIELFRKVCSAVHVAHRSLVIHRDLKPSNILVTADGEPKLLDFGIAKLLDPDGTPVTVARTSTLMRLMTPEYASPEQVRGDPVTTASDVYSLGVLLYELLTGRRPYRIRSYRASELEQVVCKDLPPAPSEVVTRAVEAGKGEAISSETLSTARRTGPDRLRRELSGDLDNIVLMALRKEPDRRYASAEQLSEDLARFLDGHPVRARQDTVGYRVSKFVRRHVLGVGAAVVVSALIIAFGAAMTVQAARIAEERDAAAAERRRVESALELLVDLFRVSDPAESPGETITARELLERGTRRVREEMSDQPEMQATLLLKIGHVYRNLGLYDDALETLRESLEKTRQTAGDDSQETVLVLDELGHLHQARGEYDDAEASFREALELSRSLHGNEHPDVAAGLNNLGHLLYAKGEYDESLALLRDSLARSRRIADQVDADFAPTLDNLGQLLQAQGNYDEAEPLFREALALREAEYDPDHPEVLLTLNNLASLLHDLGKYDEAETLYRRSLEAAAETQGDDHPEFAITLSNLSMLLGEKGDYESAAAGYRRVLEIFEVAYGPDHPHVATVLGNLAGIQRLAGDVEDAEANFRRALDIQRRVLGEDHLSVAITENNLGKLLDIEERYGEAEPLYRDTLRILRNEFGEEHPYYAKGLSNLATLLDARGETEAAEPLYRRSLELRRSIWGESHLEVALGLTQLAGHLREKGDLEQAEEAYRKAIPMYRDHAPEGSADIAYALVGLGELMEKDRGDPASAEPLYREAVTVRRAGLPAGSWLVHGAEAGLGRSLAAQGRDAEAREVLKAALRGFRATLGENHDRTVEVRDLLATLDSGKAE